MGPSSTARKRTTTRPARKSAAPVPDDVTGAAAPAPRAVMPPADTTGAAGESLGLDVGTYVRFNNDDGAPQLGRVLHSTDAGVLVIEPIGTVARHVSDVLAVEVTA